jgi:hypothetical protein
VGPDTSIIFATALSQEPYTKNKRYYYNIKNYSEFFEKFSICSSVKVKPLMAEQFLLELGNEKQARELMDRLNSFEMDSGDYFHVGSNLLFLVSQNNNELLVQCRCTKQVPTSASFHNVNNPNITTPFHELFYEMKETKTGVHNPIGLYWKKGLTAQTSTDTSRVKPSQIHYDILEYFE